MFRRIFLSLISVFVVGLILIGLFRTKVYHERRFLMGTECVITVYYRGRPPQRAVEKAFSAIELIDSLASFFSPHSDISRINRQEDFIPDLHTRRMIREAMRVGDMTGGAFDITCGPIMDLWKSFKKEAFPAPEDIKRAKALVDYRLIDTTEGRIRIPDGMSIDLSGIATGYAINLAVQVLLKNGVHTGLVNCGGDIKVFGNKIFNIGVRHPRAEGIERVVEIKNEAITTSGDYESYFIREGERFHHIIDPTTGYPTEGPIAVTVVSGCAMFADGLATALMVMGLERGDSLLWELGDVRGIIYGECGDSLVKRGDI